MKYRRPDAVANDTELVVNGTDVTDVFERRGTQTAVRIAVKLEKMRPTVFCLSAFCIFV